MYRPRNDGSLITKHLGILFIGVNSFWLGDQLCFLCATVWFKKTSISTLWKVIGNSEGVGVSKAQTLQGKYGATLGFQEGWGGSN